MHLGADGDCTEKRQMSGSTFGSVQGNHQKAESKTHAQSMEKLKTQEKEIERNYKTLKKHLHALQEGKTIKDHVTVYFVRVARIKR